MTNGGVLAALISVTVVVASSASAASITSTLSKENKTIVLLNGEIAEGDADRLKAIIKSANDFGRPISGMRLNSPGGSLLEGTKLAELINYAKIATVVANGTKCASACFLAFAAGSQKFVSYTASIGVHGASDKFGQELGDATVSMARIVKELGVPNGIIGKMVVTRPDEIVWLTPDDLRSMGATMTGRPAQVGPEQSATVQSPMQLAPSTKAVAPQAPRLKEWSEVSGKSIRTFTTAKQRPTSCRPCM